MVNFAIILVIIAICFSLTEMLLNVLNKHQTKLDKFFLLVFRYIYFVLAIVMAFGIVKFF